MSNRLVLLLGDFVGSEKEAASVLAEWADAGLLGVVAWTSVDPNALVRPVTTVCDGGAVSQKALFDLLTSRIWSQVSVVAIRQKNVATLEQSRFDAETRVLQMVQDAFAAHKDLEFQSFTGLGGRGVRLSPPRICPSMEDAHSPRARSSHRSSCCCAAHVG